MRRINRRDLAWLLPSLLLGSLLGCGIKVDETHVDRLGEPEDAGPVEQSKAAAATEVDLAILDYEGIQGVIESHRGKVVVMDAWATSCGPCVREFPHLVALSKKYPAENLACISLSFDYFGGDPPEDLKPAILEFLQKQDARFDNILSSVPDSELYKKFDLDAVPAVFVYGRDGKLARRFDYASDGDFSYADIEPFVAKLVAQ